MEPWPTGIDAITLFVEDLVVTKQFYQSVFGLPVLFEDSNSTVFNFGNLVINLLRVSEAGSLIGPAKVGDRHAGARYQLTLPVDNVDDLCKKLGAAGVTLLNGPMDRPWGIRTAAFEDPSGHIWEVAHKL